MNTAVDFLDNELVTLTSHLLCSKCVDLCLVLVVDFLYRS